MKAVKGFRFVTDDLKSEHGKVQWKIGEWQHQDGKLELCENGFHASKKPLDSLDYLFGSRWFHCEAKGEILNDSDKFCASDMRITQEIDIMVILQFAYECALHVLPIYEKYYPKDKRVRECLEAVKRYLDTPTEKHKRELAAAEAAAWAAARAAARDAARDAAWDAARAAARAAAWAAAWDAAWDAARAAAGDAAREKERRWQKRKLNQILKTFADKNSGEKET